MSNTLDAFSANDVPAAGANLKVRSFCIIIDRFNTKAFTKPLASMWLLYTWDAKTVLFYQVLTFLFIVLVFHRCYVNWTIEHSSTCFIYYTWWQWHISHVYKHIVKYMRIQQVHCGIDSFQSRKSSVIDPEFDINTLFWCQYWYPILVLVPIPNTAIAANTPYFYRCQVWYPILVLVLMPNSGINADTNTGIRTDPSLGYQHRYLILVSVPIPKHIW